MSETAALPAALCPLWKETKEKLMEKVKSPVTTREEAYEALWTLFQMYVYEKENPKDFIQQKKENTIGDVLHPGLHMIGQLARSQGSPCLVKNVF